MDHDHEDDDNLQQDEHLQVGFVEIFQPLADPVFASAQAMNLDAVRLWANFFSATNADKPVQVPPQWTEFIAALLANPLTFSWTKDFLQSKTWSFLNQSSPGLNFSLPENHPSFPVPPCLKELSLPTISSELDSPVLGTPNKDLKGKSAIEESSPSTPIESIKHKISPSTGPWSKAFLEKAEAVKQGDLLENPQKRRSQRMQNLKKGFKDPQ